MIRHKSGQFAALKIQPERDQPPAGQREPQRALGSVEGSVTRTVAGGRTESGTTAASGEADADPAANLFPVRAGQSGPLPSACERAPGRAPPVVVPRTVRTFPGALLKRQGPRLPLLAALSST